MGNRVPVLSPDGQFGFLDEEDVPKLPSGARVLSKQEVAQKQLEDKYDKKSTLQKAAGLVTPALPLPAQMAVRGAGIAPMPPELEAYRAGASGALTGGLEDL